MVEGHPLLSYAIKAAIDTNIFESVHVCTDSVHYREIARSYGAQCESLRPPEVSTAHSPDCEWVSWFFETYAQYKDFDYAFILRPTSPFRHPSTIKSAFDVFTSSRCDTLRAVRTVNEHPGKMWVPQGDLIIPLLPFSVESTPFHSNQTAKLFPCYIQDASLEIFTVSNFTATGSITGSSIVPFINQGFEGFDLNTPDDVQLMFELIASNKAMPYRCHDIS